MKNMNLLASRLLSLRKERALTQEAVAEKLNVSRQTVAKWEAGESAPDIENAMLLARLYDVTLDSLVGATENGALSPRGKHIFGFVKVGERGQIVIPKRAREIFLIRPGEKLLVLGDEAQGGIALVKASDFADFAAMVLQKVNEGGLEE